MDEKRTEALRDWVSIVTGMVRSIAGLQSVDEASAGDFGRSEVEHRLHVMTIGALYFRSREVMAITF